MENNTTHTAEALAKDLAALKRDVARLAEDVKHHAGAHVDATRQIIHEKINLAREAAASRPLVILGAGLDTFAQRHSEIASQLRIFEVDQPGTQKWKRSRLIELGFGIPDRLRLVPVDFETGDAHVTGAAGAARW